jgi:aryl-alcohol dehydrogenase-like predicted oxidoreductase
LLYTWQVMEALWTSDRLQTVPSIRHGTAAFTTFSSGASSASWCRWQGLMGLPSFPGDPLAAGLLSGKYGHGKAPLPDEARYARWPGNPLEKARWVQPVY